MWTSPYKRKCWTNSGGPLISSSLWGPQPTSISCYLKTAKLITVLVCLGCGVAQLVVRRLAVTRARVRHPKGPCWAEKRWRYMKQGLSANDAGWQNEWLYCMNAWEGGDTWAQAGNNQQTQGGSHRWAPARSCTPGHLSQFLKVLSSRWI